MFSVFSNIFKKKAEALPDFSAIGVDMHSHLIPGIDDGAETLENSLVLLDGLHEMGFHSFVTTPHIMSDYYKNSSDIILPLTDQVRKEIQKKHPQLNLKAAAEYYVDDMWDSILVKEPLMELGGKHVLFEMNYVNRPMNIMENIFEIKIKGLKPVLAHPERYTFLQHSIKEYQALRDYEVLFQINLGSLIGYYGPQAKKIAEQLIENNWVEFIGTDTHHIKHVQGFRNALSNPYLKKLIDSGRLLNHTLFQ